MKKLGLALIVLIVLAWLALVVFLGTPFAWAHGAAQWIQDGGYRSALGSSCCGPSDCVDAGQATWRMLDGGERYEIDVVIEGKLRTLTAPKASVHQSKDNDVWYCALAQDWMEGKARCVFLPGSV